MPKPRVAFVCVHNSCRSQMAEALARKLAGDLLDSYSAGTQRRERINQDAVRLMKRRYGIDMERTQRPKLLDALPEIDILVTMGCNVQCPFLPCRRREDWGLDDPSGQGDAAFLRTMDLIEERLRDLVARLPALAAAWDGTAGAATPCNQGGKTLYSCPE